MGSDIESLSMQEEKDFRDYILVFPIPNMSPVYVYLSKPPVKLFEVDLYRNFSGRPRNGTHAEFQHYLKRQGIMADITAMIKSLGQTVEQLVEKKLISDKKFEYLFEGADTFNYEPEAGLILVFDDKSRKLRSVEFTLISTSGHSGNSEMYHGEMPPPFTLSMDKIAVRALLGEPDVTSEETKVPVIGVVGGHDCYIRKLQSVYPDTNIRVLYLKDLRVRGLVFEREI